MSVYLVRILRRLERRRRREDEESKSKSRSRSRSRNEHDEEQLEEQYEDTVQGDEQDDGDAHEDEAHSACTCASQGNCSVYSVT